MQLSDITRMQFDPFESQTTGAMECKSIESGHFH